MINEDERDEFWELDEKLWEKGNPADITTQNVTGISSLEHEMDCHHYTVEPWHRHRYGAAAALLQDMEDARQNRQLQRDEFWEWDNQSWEQGNPTVITNNEVTNTSSLEYKMDCTWMDRFDVMHYEENSNVWDDGLIAYEWLMPETLDYV